MPGDGGQAGGLALLVDDPPLDVVHRHGVGRQEAGALYSQANSGLAPNGPFWKIPRMPSMIWRTHFLRKIGWLTTSGMKVLQALESGVECDRATLLTEPWLMFLRAPVTPAEPWSLRTGSITILFSRFVMSVPRCERTVRSSLGSLPLPHQVHLDEFVAVVAGDGVASKAREIDQELGPVIVGRQTTPFDPFGNRLVHPGRSSTRSGIGHRRKCRSS